MQPESTIEEEKWADAGDEWLAAQAKWMATGPGR